MIAQRFRRFLAGWLTDRASTRARQDDPEGAMALLRRAKAIDPTYGRAHHDSARLYGQKLRRFDVAEEAARQAIACEPGNPEFQNSLFGILIDRARTLRTREAVVAQIGACLAQVEAAIAADPAYPPCHISKAAALALGGRPESQWQPELDAAWKLYGVRSQETSSRQLAQTEVDHMLARSRTECEALARYWKNLPES